MIYNIFLSKIFKNTGYIFRVLTFDELPQTKSPPRLTKSIIPPDLLLVAILFWLRRRSEMTTNLVTRTHAL
jgi:hypothetical protein